MPKVIQDETGMFDKNCELTLWPEDEVLTKYNHNHGDHGRFTSGGGAGGGGGAATMPAEGEGEGKYTREEQMALRDYAGAEFAFMNTYSRNPGGPGAEYYERKSRNLDKMIDKQAPLKGEEIVYRGLRPSKDMEKALVKDAILEDKGFMSTSKDREVAKNFGNYVMAIRVPKGTKALQVEDYIHTVAAKNEKELLLGRGTKLKITHVRQESGGLFGMGKKVYIEARVVD